MPFLKKPSALNIRKLILYEDNHLLAINKPAGLLVQKDITGDTSLLEFAKAYLKEKYHKPGNVYLGLVHRLDRVTSGIVVLARTSKAASRLSAALKERRIEKYYLALVHGIPMEEGKAEDLLRWDEKAKRALVSSSGKLAVLEWKTLKSWGSKSLLLIKPSTGRKHQIRAQLAVRGYPIVGDFKYGSRQRIAAGRGILLHAWRLFLPHPTKKEIIFLEAPLPGHWPRKFFPTAGEFTTKKFAFPKNLG